MKTLFLPKELNGIKNKRACFHINKSESATAPHWHDCVEIMFMKRGAARIFFDGKWQTLNEGELFFAPPNSVHCCVLNDDNTEQVVIGFRDELICDSYSPDYSHIFPFYSQRMEGFCIIKSAEATASILKLSELDDGEEFNTVRAYSLIIAIYADILNCWRELGALEKKAVKNPKVIEIMKHVREHATEPITAESTAKALNISYSYMARLLAEEAGIGFCNLLLSSRIDIAKRLIASTDKSITEIGYDCGFCATSAFIQSFKKMTGRTPLAYRKSCLERK